MRSRNQKYNNRKVTQDGIEFDSKKERQMYRVLKQRKADGLIRDLETQPTFVLQERFSVVKKGKTRVNRPITYIADFKFFDIEQDRWRVLDAKGKRTAVYLIKKKLFDWKFRGQYYLEETL